MVRCVDYVQVRLNNGLLVNENCGNDTTGVSALILPFGIYNVIWYINYRDQQCTTFARDVPRFNGHWYFSKTIYQASGFIITFGRLL